MTKTYGPQEVCDAAGVPRATFHSWIARRYFHLPPGPGIGRERRFSFTDAVRIAIVAELVRTGMTVGSAANAAAKVQEPFKDGERRLALVLLPSPTLKDDIALHGPSFVKMTFSTFEEIAFFVAMKSPQNRAVSFSVLDVTDVAERTQAALENQTPVFGTPSWLERYLSASANILPDQKAPDSSSSLSSPASSSPSTLLTRKRSPKPRAR